MSIDNVQSATPISLVVPAWVADEADFAAMKLGSLLIAVFASQIKNPAASGRGMELDLLPNLKIWIAGFFVFAAERRGI